MSRLRDAMPSSDEGSREQTMNRTNEWECRMTTPKVARAKLRGEKAAVRRRHGNGNPQVLIEWDVTRTECPTTELVRVVPALRVPAEAAPHWIFPETWRREWREAWILGSG